MTILGQGDHLYEVVDAWAKLPREWTLGDVAAVAVDRRDNVYLFTRGEHPMIVLDSNGNVLRTWGHGVFKRPHGLHIGHDDRIYCTDDGDHTVRRCTLDGRIELTIGVPGRPAPFMSGEPFHRCTHTALGPQGELYVADGYGNACVHQFDPAGRRVRTWGECGTAQGQFYLPHNLVCDPDGWVYVADRENHRVQIFDPEGRYETQWSGIHRPCALCRSTAGTPTFYIGQAGPALTLTLDYPNLGPRLSILDGDGALLAHVDRGPASLKGFIAPHGIAVDGLGDLYVGEVSRTAWPSIFPDEAPPAVIPSLTKLRRLTRLPQ